MSLVTLVTALAEAIGADIKNLILTKNRDRVYTNATATGTITLDLSLYDIFDLTLAGNVTLVFSNAPTLTDEGITPIIRITCGATGYTTTWMSGISLWLNSDGVAPAGPVAGKTGEFVFTTQNGTSYIARKGSKT